MHDRRPLIPTSSTVFQRCARLLRATALASAVFVFQILFCAPALAHGLSADASERTTFGFVGLGIEHMLLGWDHLLFVAGILGLAGTPRRAAKLISVFVAGHSLTLISASVAGWQVSPELVDAVITASLVFVGGVGMFGRPARLDWFGSVIFVFGLVHGLGLATRLHDLGLPEDGLLWKVIAFNVGVEIGQVTAIVGMLGLYAVTAMSLRKERLPSAARAGAAALVLIGAMATAVLGYRAMTPTVPAAAVVFQPPEGSTCALEDQVENLPVTGGHPSKAFFGPDEHVPLASFGHSLGDGYVLVFYPRETSKDSLDELRAFMATPTGKSVLAGPAPQGTDPRVLTLRQTLACEELEPDTVRMFTQNWNENRVRTG